MKKDWSHMPLGENLKKARQSVGLSTHKLGLLSERAGSEIVRIEKKKTTNPGVYTVQSLASILDVDIGELTGSSVVKSSTHDLIKELRTLNKKGAINTLVWLEESLFDACESPSVGGVPQCIIRSMMDIVSRETGYSLDDQAV